MAKNKKEKIHINCFVYKQAILYKIAFLNQDKMKLLYGCC